MDTAAAYAVEFVVDFGQLGKKESDMQGPRDGPTLLNSTLETSITPPVMTSSIVTSKAPGLGFDQQ